MADKWQKGAHYNPDDVVNRNNQEWTAIQDHDSETGKEPENTEEVLWKKGPSRQAYFTETEDTVRKSYSQGITINLNDFKERFDEIKKEIENTPQKKDKGDTESRDYWNEMVAMSIEEQKERLKHDINRMQQIKDYPGLRENFQEFIREVWNLGYQAAENEFVSELWSVGSEVNNGTEEFEKIFRLWQK